MILTPVTRPPRNNWMEDPASGGEPHSPGINEVSPSNSFCRIHDEDPTLSRDSTGFSGGGSVRGGHKPPCRDNSGSTISTRGPTTSRSVGGTPRTRASLRSVLPLLSPVEVVAPSGTSKASAKKSRRSSTQSSGQQKAAQDGSASATGSGWNLNLRSSLPALMTPKGTTRRASALSGGRSPRASILNVRSANDGRRSMPLTDSIARPASRTSIVLPPRDTEPESLQQQLSRTVGSRHSSLVAQDEDLVEMSAPLSQHVSMTSILSMAGPRVHRASLSHCGSMSSMREFNGSKVENSPRSSVAWTSPSPQSSASHHKGGCFSEDLSSFGPVSDQSNVGFAVSSSMGDKRNLTSGQRSTIATSGTTAQRMTNLKAAAAPGSIFGAAHSVGSSKTGHSRQTALHSLMINVHSLNSHATKRWWHSHSLHNWRKKAAPYCRWLMKTKAFQISMFLALMSALFLPDLWVLVDRPHNHDLDVLLTFVLILFLGELVVQSIGLMRTYWGSFFFWMDCIGACSLLVDLSYVPLMDLLDGAGGQDVSNNVIIMRAARIAKLGARAGRFTKLVKLLRFLPGMSQDTGDQFTAKVISAKLLMALSTRVSCLIIIMVMVMPIFNFWQFPEQDWSMVTWMELLETAGLKYGRRGFEEQLREFQNFYRDLSYFPYHIVVDIPGAHGVSGSWQLESKGRGNPKREGNSRRIKRGSSLKCDFNFTSPNQIDALMNMALILLIMVLMILFSLQISNSVSGLVLRPLEKMLKQVKECAATIFKSVTDMTDSISEEEEEDYDSHSSEDEYQASGLENETALLEKVVEKLAVLGTLVVQKGVDDDAVQGLSESDRGIFDHYTAAAATGGNQWHKDNNQDEMEVLDNTEMLKAQRAMIQSAGLSLELIDSWNLNPLEIDKARCHAAAMFFLGPQNHGIMIDPIVMSEFLRAAEAGYNSVPYHSWFHAVDVTHAVYRMMQILCSEAYFSGQERFAVLASAICHDLGHPGVNNPFLIETSHELALRYNDRSPLENMHCARLFEVVSVPRNNIFSDFSDKDYQDARKCCIEAILHTDSKQHFDMIKEVQLLYEVNSEIMVESREAFQNDSKDFPSKEVTNCFRVADTRALLRRLILHTADISNPTKPFRICRIWAWKCLEEMFLQGDNEKALGVPVQSLNDREKVNRPFSQVGFIEFLVAPLAFSIVKVLPPFENSVEVLIDNLKLWQQQWVSETQPQDTDRRALEERIFKLEKRFLEGS